MDRFIWQPADGIDAAALARLQKHFERPKEPMGEAWFMGQERRFFHELTGDLSELSVQDLQKPLEEIASGTSAFEPLPEWRSWYHYLLGQLLTRSHESFVSPLLELLITGFMALYPNGVHSGAYRQFRDDALLTLGRCMMDSQCWDGADIVVGSMLHRSDNNPNRVWCWWNASGDFSASMFFCLKYLPTTLVRDWLRSVLLIKSPHWRAQVLVWLVGSHDILTGRVQWPSEFPLEARPTVDWDWSHCLRAELATADASGALATPSLLSGTFAIPSLLPEDCRVQALNAVDRYFTEEVFREWLLSISTVPYLEAELAELPLTFEGLYVQTKQA